MNSYLLLLTARFKEGNEKGYFWKDNFPLDVFKIIFNDVIEYEEEQWISNLSRNHYLTSKLHDSRNSNHYVWYPMEESGCKFHIGKSYTEERLIRFFRKSSSVAYNYREFQTQAACEAMIEVEPYALRHVRHDLMTKELCEMAYKRNKKTIQFIPEKFITKDMCLESIKIGACYASLPYNFMKDKEIAKAALREDYENFRFVPDVIIEEMLRFTFLEKNKRIKTEQQ